MEESGQAAEDSHMTVSKKNKYCISHLRVHPTNYNL